MTEAEVLWLREKEFARTADDIVWRRTKLGLRMTAEEIAARVDASVGAVKVRLHRARAELRSHLVPSGPGL